MKNLLFLVLIIYPFWADAQISWQQSGTNKLFLNSPGTTALVGVNTSNPTCRLDFGTSYSARMISLFGNTSDFYGLGIAPGKLRFQIMSGGNHSFGFFNGGSTEIANLNQKGSLSLMGDDPDITLKLNSGSTSNLLQFRFKVGPNEMAEIRYNRASDNLIFRHGTDDVITIDHNATDYWVTVRRGIQAWKVKTSATLADYVFSDGYELMPLPTVEEYIDNHHHLPGVISQSEVDANGGVELTSFIVQLQEKLEELYLHTIELEKRLTALEAENELLKGNTHD